MKAKLFIIVFWCLTSASCVSIDKTEKRLDELDGLVKNRHDIYAQYEAELKWMKDSLASADTYHEKWEWADRLYDSYSYYSMDSTLAYVNQQKKYASSIRQEYLTTLNEMYVTAYRHNETAAEQMFLSLDTLIIDNLGLKKDYYSGGISLYSYIKTYSTLQSAIKADDELKKYRKLYLDVDSTSSYAHRTRAVQARDRGDYEYALNILDSLASVESDTHNQALIAFNQSLIYERMENQEGKIEALIRSVEFDLKSAVRTYLSLYNLALIEYEKNSLERANLYMSANMTDAIAGGFNTRMIDAGKMQMIISEASMEQDKEQIMWMFGVICSFIIILVLVITLFVKNVRHSRRQKEIKDMLLEVNSQLKTANQDLKLANKIKDSYVFSYMELAITYLQKLEDSRREVRAIAKNEGLEAVIKILRSPSYIYEEYKHYYTVFDEAFLGIFPDFREKVNLLLKEDSRFPISDAPVLCTELRVLAAIRLGITESGKIATFLNCAPTTVYTYRTRLKRAAICTKEEFEALIASI